MVFLSKEWKAESLPIADKHRPAAARRCDANGTDDLSNTYPKAGTLFRGIAVCSREIAVCSQEMACCVTAFAPAVPENTWFVNAAAYIVNSVNAESVSSRSGCSRSVKSDG